MARHHRWLGRGVQGPGFCNWTIMKDPPVPEPPDDRIARATARVNAAMARASQAQAVLIEANVRLAAARLALGHARSQDAHESPADGDPMEATDTS